MKKILCALLLFSTFAVPCLNAAPARGTADYYIQNSQKYLDGNVQIFAVDVKMTTRVSPDGYLAFLVTTMSGEIFFFVPQKSVKKFIAGAPRAGLNGEIRNTKSYSGVLKKMELGKELVWAIMIK